jgi:hypothetical protein
MAAKAEKIRIPMQLGSVLKVTRNGEISLSNPELEMEPSEAVADAVLAYSFDPHTGEHFIEVVEPLSFKPRP